MIVEPLSQFYLQYTQSPRQQRRMRTRPAELKDNPGYRAMR